MFHSVFHLAAALFAAGLMAAVQAAGAATTATALPTPVIDVPANVSRAPQTAVFAGGCFWGVEAVFRHVKGVSSAVSGYAGGTVKAPDYVQVSRGTTGHAESVKVTYDPARISYGQLLEIFFAVAHDPTQLNRQGPDTGTQYRSAIFTTNDDQTRVARAYIEQLERAKVFARPIVTEVVPLPAFYEAESYHQNYVALHPTQPYVAINDLPKVGHLRERFPALYAGK